MTHHRSCCANYVSCLHIRSSLPSNISSTGCNTAVISKCHQNLPPPPLSRSSTNVLCLFWISGLVDGSVAFYLFSPPCLHNVSHFCLALHLSSACMQYLAFPVSSGTIFSISTLLCAYAVFYIPCLHVLSHAPPQRFLPYRGI